MEKFKIWTEEDARRCIATPTPTDDKYSRGVLGVITGSRKYPGAAVLSCEGALQTGVGMVRYYGPRIARLLVLRQRPEVVIQPGQVQAWLIGSGIDGAKLGRRRKKLIESALRQQVPAILDAGAISLISNRRAPTLITPHFRELHLLLASTGTDVSLEEIQNEPTKWARIAAEQFKVCVLLKGNQTVIVSTQTSIHMAPATPWLATAGTGDVLSGILGALLATHAEQVINDPEFLADLAATGSFIHSEAALLSSQGGPITPSQLSIAIHGIISKLLARS